MSKITNDDLNRLSCAHMATVGVKGLNVVFLMLFAIGQGGRCCGVYTCRLCLHCQSIRDTWI